VKTFEEEFEEELQPQTDGEEVGLPVGVTDEELAKLLDNILHEGMATNLSTAEAMNFFEVRAKSLGVQWEQYSRVIKNFIATRDYLIRMRNAGREFAKSIIEVDGSFDDACELLAKKFTKGIRPEDVNEAKEFLSQIWESVKLEVEQERQLQEEAKVIAEAEQFKKLERVERRRQRRAQREADRLEAERIKQAEQNTAAAKAAKEQKKADARRRAAELDQKHRQKEEAKRQAWLEAHPKRNVNNVVHRVA
jgi:hypothetical protein